MPPTLSSLTLTNILQTKKCGNILKYPRINNVITPAATYCVLPCNLSDLKTVPRGNTEYFTKAKFYVLFTQFRQKSNLLVPKLTSMCIKQTRTNHIATKWAIMTFFIISINILPQLKSEATFHTNIKQHKGEEVKCSRYKPGCGPEGG